MSVPSDRSRRPSDPENTGTPSRRRSKDLRLGPAAADTRSTAPSGGPSASSGPRRLWSCGEASWLKEVAGITDLKATLGYPRRFTARETVQLIQAGVTRDQAAWHPGTVEEVIACHG